MFFFFKQKTAYEMRISDWSSDVCSSDLEPDRRPYVIGTQARNAKDQRHPPDKGAKNEQQDDQAHHFDQYRRDRADRLRHRSGDRRTQDIEGGDRRRRRRARRLSARRSDRSEEHTSELQSLMRTSYAVFCLKKKTKKDDRIRPHINTV